MIPCGASHFFVVVLLDCNSNGPLKFNSVWPDTSHVTSPLTWRQITTYTTYAVANYQHYGAVEHGEHAYNLSGVICLQAVYGSAVLVGSYRVNKQ